MTLLTKNLVGAALILGATVGAAHASDVKLKEIYTVTLPGKPLVGFDTGYVDQKAGLFFLADAPHAQVDIVNVATGKYVGAIKGFTGGHFPDFATSGPSGFAAIDGNLWVTNGDSTVKVVDLSTDKIIASVSTGGKDRADEMTYDPRDHILAVENDSDPAPFVTFISTLPGYKVLGHIPFPQASGGLDEPDYYPGTGMFYMSVDGQGNNANAGFVAVLNPRTVSVVKMIPVNNCDPAGTAFGPNGNFALGCDAGSPDSGLPPEALIMNVDGSVVAKFTQIGGVDQVAYNPNTRQYYFAAAGNPAGSSIGVVDADTNAWVENVPTGGHAHALAVSYADNHILVPRPVKNGNCGPSGCIGVYAPVAAAQ
jgi:hypothetical protein